jgi:glutathione peroxidase
MRIKSALIALVLAGGALAAALALAAPPATATAKTAYDFKFDGLTGGQVPFSAYKGKVVMVVNTASKCGFTPQYEGLQKLYDARKTKNFVIVGVPSGDFNGQELGSSKEIAEFCKLNYGVTFPMATKNSVVGDAAHPFYKWAQSSFGDAAKPKWNFHKIVLGKNGKVVAAFGSRTSPDDPAIAAAIDKAQAAS